MSEAIASRTYQAWSYGPDGRNLVEATQGGVCAKVCPATADADELVALANACLAAAKYMTSGRLDYAVVESKRLVGLESLSDDIKNGATAAA